MSWIDPQRNGGYKKEWFKEHETLDTFGCSICTEIVCEPVNLENCPHVFCRSCLEQYWQNAENNCPTCRGKHASNIIQINGFVRAQVHQLFIHCPGGCAWNGTLGTDNRNLKEHMAVCSHFGVNCTLGCDTIVQRKDMKQHIVQDCPLRLVTCTCCDKTMEWKFFVAPNHAGEHEPTMFQQPRLDNTPLCLRAERCRWAGCTDILAKDLLQQHLVHECPRRLVDCIICEGATSHTLPFVELHAHILSHSADKLASCLIRRLVQPSTPPVVQLCPMDKWYLELHEKQVDFECDVRDYKGFWYQAVFKAISGTKVTVHFWNWSVCYNEVIDVIANKECFAPLGTHTKGRHQCVPYVEIPPIVAPVVVPVVPVDVPVAPVVPVARVWSVGELYLFRKSLKVGDTFVVRPRSGQSYTTQIVKLYGKDPEHNALQSGLYVRPGHVSQYVWFYDDRRVLCKTCRFWHNIYPLVHGDE